MIYCIGSRCRPKIVRSLKAIFHSGKLSVDWNGQENFSLSCELWIGTNDFKTKKNFPVRSNPRIIFLSRKLALMASMIRRQHHHAKSKCFINFNILNISQYSNSPSHLVDIINATRGNWTDCQL